MKLLRMDVNRSGVFRHLISSFIRQKTDMSRYCTPPSPGSSVSSYFHRVSDPDEVVSWGP